MSNSIVVQTKEAFSEKNRTVTGGRVVEECTGNGTTKMHTGLKEKNISVDSLT